MLKDMCLESQDRYNILEKNKNKQPDSTLVKIPKLTNLIMRPKYPYKK